MSPAAASLPLQPRQWVTFLRRAYQDLGDLGAHRVLDRHRGDGGGGGAAGGAGGRSGCKQRGDQEGVHEASG